jgi:hypothetical protein
MKISELLGLSEAPFLGAPRYVNPAVRHPWTPGGINPAQGMLPPGYPQQQGMMRPQYPATQPRPPGGNGPPAYTGAPRIGNPDTSAEDLNRQELGFIKQYGPQAFNPNAFQPTVRASQTGANRGQIPPVPGRKPTPPGQVPMPTPQGDQYPEVGRPVEGNPSRTNTGPTPTAHDIWGLPASREGHQTFAGRLFRAPEDTIGDALNSINPLYWARGGPNRDPDTGKPVTQAPPQASSIPAATRSGWSYIPGTTDWFKELPGSLGLGAPANAGGARMN